MPEQLHNFSPSSVTRLLHHAGADGRASAELLPLVYQELRALAAKKMRQERADAVLQTTALVHEAYIRLVDQTNPPPWEGRWHFFAAAAEAMRRILVENARSRGRLKRGGGAPRISLDQTEFAIDDPSPELLALDEALLELERQHPQKAQIVKLRYFAGLTQDEAALALGISPRTAGRAWAYARAWLYERINSNGPEQPDP